MSRTPLEKVHKLIALVLGGASEEEGRTAAVAAVRLISQHSLLGIAPQPGRYRPPVSDPPPRPAPPPPEKWNGPIVSQWSQGTCGLCGQGIRMSQYVVWLGKRVRHASCHGRQAAWG